GKQRGQHIHAAAGLLSSRLRAHLHLVQRAFVHQATPVRLPCSAGITASTEDPPRTREPVFTFNSASAGTSTSTREPNLMRPTLWPRSTRSPTFRLHTIRLASRPAICL